MLTIRDSVARSPSFRFVALDAGLKAEGQGEDDASGCSEALFRSAIDLYTDVLAVLTTETAASGQSTASAVDWRVKCLHRRAMAHAKLGEYEAAVRDAEAVIEMVGIEVDEVGRITTTTTTTTATTATARREEHRVYVLKAYHRKAQALWSMGEQVRAVTTYKEGLSLSLPPSIESSESAVLLAPAADGIRAAATLMVAEMPYSWLAAYYVTLLAKCESPHPLSRRDGLVLRRVPDSVKLDAARVRGGLVDGMDGDVVFRRACQMGVVDLWSGAQRMKSLCAYVRGSVYYRCATEVPDEAMRDGLLRQAEMDATVALVYYGDEPGSDGPRAASARSYPAGHALRGRCYEARGENVLAVMDVLQAIEGAAAAQSWHDGDSDDGSDDDDDSRVFEEALSRLLPRIPEHYAAAINEGCGYAGLRKMIEVERERMQPEFMKKRPKYYYYYEWMKKRITERHPEIAEGVMDKLLALDAGELDLLLQYPQAIDATVHELESVLAERGGDALETYEVPLLSWGDVQRYKSGKEVSELENGDGVSSRRATAAIEG